MPRDTITLNGFESGLANDPSRVDLNDNELYQAQDVDLDKHGIVSVLSRYDIVTSPDWSSKITVVKTIEPGYGLYSFSADYDVNGSAVSTDYIVVAGKTTDNNKVVQVFDTSGNVLPTTSGSSSITIATGDTTPFYPNFYYVDGSLRICDGNLNSTKSSNYKLVYLNHTIFENSTYESTISGWKYFQNTYSEPSRGIAIKGQSIDFSVGTPTTNQIPISTAIFSSMTSAELTGHTVVSLVSGITTQYFARQILDFPSTYLSMESTTAAFGSFGYIFPPAGNVNIGILPFSSTTVRGDGTFPEGVYNIGVSFKYEDGQESKVKKLVGTVEASSGIAPYSFYVNCFATIPMNPRITAFNVYSKKSTGDDGNWDRIAHVRLRDGIVKNENSPPATDNPHAWSENTLLNGLPVVGSTLTSSNVYLVVTKEINSGDGETHRSISGFGGNTSDITARYKTVAISNRSAYIGNVKINGNMLNDSILKSKPNKFDQFTEEDRLDVVLSDGDEIIRLESFEDRILQFKKRKLYVINVSQDIEFLEGSHDFKGITDWHHVVRTEHGIVWFNEFGVYLYDGRDMLDLFMDFSDIRRRKISLSEWQDFLGSNPSITYDRRSRKILILSKLSGTGSVNVYSFDLNGFRWVSGLQKLGSTATNRLHTNFITDSNFSSVSIDGSSLDMYKWSASTTQSSTAFTFETKSINLDLPGVDKKLYVVYVKHRNSGGSVKVRYRINDTSNLYSFSTTYLPNSSTYVTTRLTPINTSESYNWDSVSFVVSSSSVSSSFELDNMEIIYRVKGLR